MGMKKKEKNMGRIGLLCSLIVFMIIANVVVVIKMYSIHHEIRQLSEIIGKTRVLAEWFVEEAKTNGLLPGAGGAGAKVAELLLQRWIRT